MICLSLNLRGTGGTQKLASVRRFLDKTCPDLVFLQETLVHSKKARRFLSSIRPYWYCCAVSSVGNLGGLLVSWNPSVYELNASLTYGGILLEGHIIASKRILSILNIYGPCTEKRLFWTNLSASGILSKKNIIIAGDLNVTLYMEEVWGGSNFLAHTAVFYKSLFQVNHLIDLAPDKLVPTWRNGRWGSTDIQETG
jgi:exonuclease III